jgi:cytochrome c-type biogenesis protein
MTGAVPGTGVLVFALGAGLTTFFAPCAFPLLPGYVGYSLQQSRIPGVAAAGAAAAGALATLAAVSGLAFVFGRTLTGLLPAFEPLVGAGLVVFGVLVATGRVPAIHVPLSRRPDSVAGFGVFGAAYALAAAGCVVPLFLGVVGQAATLPLPAGAAVLGAYAAGVTAPLAGITLLTGAGVGSWRSAGRFSRYVEPVAGAVMVAAGLGQLYLSVAVLDVL